MAAGILCLAEGSLAMSTPERNNDRCLAMYKMFELGKQLPRAAGMERSTRIVRHGRA